MRKLMVPLFALFAGACSGGGTRTVSGQLDTTQMSLSNAQVVAISTAGHAYVAPVASSGAFSLSLPVGATYSLRFGNTTSAANRYDAFATLTPRAATGATRWFRLTPGAPIALGLVSRAAAAARPAAPLTTASDPSTDGSGDSASSDGQENDAAEVCDLSGGQDDIDVTSAHDLAADIDSDGDGTPDSADTSDDRSECASAAASGGDDCKVSGDQETELDDEANQSCAASAGGSGPAAVPGVVK